jgi:DNA-binding transcriptional ArsR family regulator
MNNNLFGSGREKILECFYKNRKREIYFSEILRDTKLTPNTTLKHLKKLEANKLIFVKKSIGNTFYRVNPKNPIAYSVFSYFDDLRFLSLPVDRRTAVSEIFRKIQAKPLIALVFGSTADKTFKKGSDVDIALIYNKKERRDEKLAREIEGMTGIAIQTFIYEYDYFLSQLKMQEDSVLLSAVETCFVVEGHHLFYKAVLE